MTHIYYKQFTADHEMGPVKVKGKRHSTGAAGAPSDIKWGGQDIAWFTGASNAIGRLESGKLTVFPRSVGGAPTTMREDRMRPTWDRGYRFIDPTGRRVGFFDNQGRIYEELELEPGLHPTSMGPSPAHMDYGYIATDGGIVIDLAGERRFNARTPTVDAIGFAHDRTWQFNGSKLTSFPAGYDTGDIVLELEGHARVTNLLSADGSRYCLVYADPGRDVIGFIEEWDQVTEVQLPPGTGLRSIMSVTDFHVWFTGHGGQSLFQLRSKRTVIEYPSATPNSDFTELAHASQALWVTEPRNNCITYIDIKYL